MTRLDGSHEIIAHRGFSARAPENTLAAMRAAIDAGTDAVEWDVQIAACGTPVLFHDDNLGRTSDGVGPLRRRPLEQLKQLDAGSWFSAEFAGERIPTLEEAYDCVRGRVRHVYSEVKAYRELEDLQRMLGVTRDSGMLDATTFISFDWRALEFIAGQEADVRIGFIVEEADQFEEALGKASRWSRSLLDFDQRLVLADPFLAARTRARGVGTCAWTVNDVGTAAELVEAGITSLTTNEVAALVEWRASLRATVNPLPG
jgi:glycerophosphoryl diester phosphodiesterase